MKKHKRGKYSDRAKKRAEKQHDKKHGVTDKDSKFTKFLKKGGISGFVNRRLKKSNLKVNTSSSKKGVTKKKEEIKKPSYGNFRGI